MDKRNIGEVVFVGAGPGNPDFITVAGRKAVESADVIIYAGSLVNPEHLKFAKQGATVYDSAGMDLTETTRVCVNSAKQGMSVVRLQTGDPSLYGAMAEQMEPLIEAGVPFRVIPGVSSAFASAAALKTPLTLPGGSQTLVFTRMSGRTGVPDAESVAELAKTGATLCIFLSVDRIEEVIADCLKGGRSPQTPCAVVYRASWPDQAHVSGTLEDIAGKVREAGFVKQSMIIVGEPLGPACLNRSIGEKSKLYDPSFTHGSRVGKP